MADPITLKLAIPNDCEECARELEDLAAKARAGQIVGFHGVAFEPGERGWFSMGWIPDKTSYLAIIGMHASAIMSLEWRSRQAALAEKDGA